MCCTIAQPAYTMGSGCSPSQQAALHTRFSRSSATFSSAFRPRMRCCRARLCSPPPPRPPTCAAGPLGAAPGADRPARAPRMGPLVPPAAGAAGVVGPLAAPPVADEPTTLAATEAAAPLELPKAAAAAAAAAPRLAAGGPSLASPSASRLRPRPACARPAPPPGPPPAPCCRSATASSWAPRRSACRRCTSASARS